MSEYTIAPIYDLVLFPFVRTVRRTILDLCEEESYNNILDVCCGTGDQLKLLRKHGFRVHGVDLSEEMLEVSRKGDHAPTCRQEDASAMSFANDEFDLAMATFALHEKKYDVARAILEDMLRVVKPGGHLMLADYRFDAGTSPFARALITFIERLAGGEHYRNFLAYTSRGGLLSLMADLPIRKVREIPLGLGSVVIELYRLNT